MSLEDRTELENAEEKERYQRQRRNHDRESHLKLQYYDEEHDYKGKQYYEATYES